MQNSLLLLGAYFLYGFIHTSHAGNLQQTKRKGDLSYKVSQRLADLSSPNQQKCWTRFSAK